MSDAGPSGTLTDAPGLGLSIDLALEPRATFDAVLDELGLRGIPLEDTGRVLEWEPGERILLERHPAPWEPELTTEVELRFEAVGDGTRVTLEHRGWERVLDDGGSELVGWFAGEVAAPLLRATSPSRFVVWLIDRRTRRPSGPHARDVYRDPLYHWPYFRVILMELALTAGDFLLELGCGGGAFLHEALRTGCRAAAVDHSPDMVRLAREMNGNAVEDGRLEIVEADAARLPFPDATFTCAAMMGVLGFLPDPVAVFREIKRVLAGGGRLVVLGSDPALRGTPAAPEPMASQLRFYEDEELERLAREAGLTDVRVERRELIQHAREAEVPEEHLQLFEGPGAPLLLARSS
jgi:SAM-dependent methyltransferase